MKIKYPYGKIYCRILKKTVFINAGGHPDKHNGWLCDCGYWTKENLRTHDVYWHGNIKSTDKDIQHYKNKSQGLNTKH